MGPLVCNEGKHHLKSPKFVDNRRIFTIEISYPNIFSLQNYFADCIVISKIFLDLVKGTMDRILWLDVATACVKPETITTPFEVTRQERISHWASIAMDTAAGQPGWSKEVAET